MGSRISDLTLLRTGKPLDAGEGLHRRRLGERQRGHRRPADLGRGRRATSRRRASLRRSESRPRPRGGHLKFARHMQFVHDWIGDTEDRGMNDRHDPATCPFAPRRSCAPRSRPAAAPRWRGPALAAGNRIRPTSRRTCRTGHACSATASPCAPTASRRKHEGARHPPRRGLAHGVAAKLGQLHAAARARRHHHAERPVLRAPSRRHRRDRSRPTTG